MSNEKTVDSKKLVVLALVCALSYVSVVLFRIPVVMFLDYEPKDCILAIAGMIYGPLPALAAVVAVSLLEMVTISTTGIIGLVMNILSSAFFVCPAVLIYRKKRSLSGAMIGLLAGCLLMSGGMVLWNWLITPLYMHIPRQAVVEMLLPMILPFNLLKAGLNATLTVLLYKSVVNALRKAHLVPACNLAASKKSQKGVILGGITVLVVLIAALLLWKMVP